MVNFSHLITKDQSKSVVNITEKVEKQTIVDTFIGDNLQDTISQPQSQYYGAPGRNYGALGKYSGEQFINYTFIGDN